MKDVAMSWYKFIKQTLSGRCLTPERKDDIDKLLAIPINCNDFFHLRAWLTI